MEPRVRRLDLGDHSWCRTRGSSSPSSTSTRIVSALLAREVHAEKRNHLIVVFTLVVKDKVK
jgi:hypothetical protein